MTQITPVDAAGKTVEFMHIHEDMILPGSDLCSLFREERALSNLPNGSRY